MHLATGWAMRAATHNLTEPVVLRWSNADAADAHFGYDVLADILSGGELASVARASVAVMPCGGVSYRLVGTDNGEGDITYIPEFEPCEEAE